MKPFFFILSVVTCLFARAQTPDTLSRTLVSSLGGFSEVNGFSLQFSVGEPVVRTAISNGGQFVLTQGFQQENLYPVSIEEGVYAMLDFQYWPNPASTELHVRIGADRQLTLNAGIYDLLGRPTGLPIQNLRVQAPVETVFDLSRLAEGNYYLTLTSEAGKILHSIKIQKIH